MQYLHTTKYVFALIAIMFLFSCVTDPYTGEKKMAKTGMGAGIGALAGAGIGALAGGSKGAMIGAGIGALSAAP